MKPSTQIEVGLWTAVIRAVGPLVKLLAFLFTFRAAGVSYRVMLSTLIVNVLHIIILAGFVFAVSRRLLKTSLPLLIGCIVFEGSVLSGWVGHWFEPFAIFVVVCRVVIIVLLLQGVIGVWREKEGG